MRSTSTSVAPRPVIPTQTGTQRLCRRATKKSNSSAKDAKNAKMKKASFDLFLFAFFAAKKLLLLTSDLQGHLEAKTLDSGFRRNAPRPAIPAQTGTERLCRRTTKKTNSSAKDAKNAKMKKASFDLFFFAFFADKKLLLSTSDLQGHLEAKTLDSGFCRNDECLGVMAAVARTLEI